MGSKKNTKKGKSESAIVARICRGRSKKPKTYRVYATCLVPHEATLEIEANSKEEAMEIAAGEDFDWQSQDDYAYFEVQSAELVEEMA